VIARQLNEAMPVVGQELLQFFVNPTEHERLARWISERMMNKFVDVISC
jgi:hypothetical protein